jgi:hypothetical protein
VTSRLSPWLPEEARASGGAGGSCEVGRGELRILLSSLFGANNPFGFAIFSRADVEDLFLASRHKLFLAADIKLFLAANFMLFLAGSC